MYFYSLLNDNPIKPHLKKLSFLLIMLCHFGFLAAILFENISNVLTMGFMIFGLGLMGFSYWKSKIKSSDASIENLFNIVFVFLGAMATYILHTNFGLSAVLASALVGLLFSFAPSINKESELLKSLPVAVYCGTFVGMTSIGVEQEYLFVAVASLFAGLLYVRTKNTFHGYGGKLGSLAFSGVVLTFFIFSILFRWS